MTSLWIRFEIFNLNFITKRVITPIIKVLQGDQFYYQMVWRFHCTNSRCPDNSFRYNFNEWKLRILFQIVTSKHFEQLSILPCIACHGRLVTIKMYYRKGKNNKTVGVNIKRFKAFLKMNTCNTTKFGQIFADAISLSVVLRRL